MAYTFKHGDRPLEGYEIQRAVGRGGFGEVYYAISDGGREVALKYLRENPEVELRGISPCINLKSPHLVSIFDVKQNSSGDYFVVMEYISGPNLRDMLIAESKGLGTQKAAFFVREIAKGLSYLHDRGIVHRDLKPGNIFYEDGYVKICDYGLSKFISISRHSAQTASVGTVHYMAPEVGSGNYSKSIDVYALGVILYEMLLGRVPYDGASMGEILMKHLTQQPEVDELDAPFPHVIRKALAKDPGDRYQVVSEMISDIFEVDNVKQSVVGFEPASLSVAAQRAAGEVRPSPVPSDNPPMPRRPRPQAPGGTFSDRFVHRTQGLDPHLTRKERRQDRRKQKHDRKRGVHEERHKPALTAEADDVVRSPYHISLGQRLGRIVAALLVTGGLSVAFGLVLKDADVGALTFLILMMSVAGLAIGHKLVSFLGPERPWLIEKLITLACTAPVAATVYSAIGQGDVGRHVFNGHIEYIYVPFLATFALVCWRDRIRMGQRGEFGWWEACAAGIVGFVAAAIAMSNDMFIAAAWMASISLALQAFAWAWVRNPAFAVEHQDALDAAPSGHDLAETLPVGIGATASSLAQPLEMPDRDFIMPKAGASKSAVQRRRRSKVTRVGAAIAAVAVCCGIVALSVLMGLGEIRCNDELAGATTGIIAMSLVFLLSLAKLGRYRRPGFWGEWLNPLLLIAAGAGIGGGASMLGFMYLRGEEVAGAIVLIVFSSISFLLLLVFRGARNKPDIVSDGFHRAIP